MSLRSKVVSAKLDTVYRYLYLIMGFLLVGIGILGIFLPVLPTTIFLILASACFMKSSPKANEWLKNNRWLGPYLKNYTEKTGLTVKSKLVLISILWISITFSAFILTDIPAIRILLLLIAIGVTIHLVMVKTAK
jgi:uncharacterized membrane protein YbaN (DUF454 family)